MTSKSFKKKKTPIELNAGEMFRTEKEKKIIDTNPKVPKKTCVSHSWTNIL